jgi:acyl-coenzyme A synthetase/AMP-(fatty) acid ligase
VPVPGYGVRLLDADGAEVGDDEPGELWASGESAAICYWGDHDRSKRTFHGDTVRTGDLFARDRDGYLSYRGRADDLLKIGGIWVAPFEVESSLLAHPQVAECAVVGAERDGLAVARAYVVRAGELDGEALRSFVRERVAPHKVPGEVVFVEDLPRTANGKVDRRALAEQAP